MILDIKPALVRPANDLEQIVMDTYKYKSLYYMQDSFGREHSVKWSENKIEDFAPSSKLSELKHNWERVFLENIIKQKTHPVDKETISEIDHKLIDRHVRNSFKGAWYNTKEAEEFRKKITPQYTDEILVFRKLTKAEISNFKSELEKFQSTGKGKFVWIKVARYMKDGKEVNQEGYTALEFAQETNRQIERIGMKVTKHEAKYCFKAFTAKEVIEKGLWLGDGGRGIYRSPKQIAADYGKQWESAFS
jgi:hypothetical protein